MDEFYLKISVKLTKTKYGDFFEATVSNASPPVIGTARTRDRAVAFLFQKMADIIIDETKNMEVSELEPSRSRG